VKKVRDILECLDYRALQRLCNARDLRSGGATHVLLKRLTASYRGNFSALLDNLYKKELVSVGSGSPSEPQTAT